MTARKGVPSERVAGEDWARQVAENPVAAEVRVVLRAASVRRAWLVGGLLRDAALGVCAARSDVDVALAGSGEGPAKAVAAALGGSAFALDEAQGAWRVALPDRSTVDLVPLRAPSLEGDLRERDFTANALALDLLGSGALVDPLGARDDLQRRVLRPCSLTALADDPVRVLRAYRFAFGLGLSFAPGLSEALAAAAQALAQCAPERVRTELFAVLGLPSGARALRAMAGDRVLGALFPFLEAWRGFDQGDYHAHDLLEHSLRAAEAAEDLAAAPEHLHLPRPDVLKSHLSEELEAGVSRVALLKLATLLHDAAKPDTLTVDGDRRRFIGHDVQGGYRVKSALERLRAARRTREAARTVVAAHLRLFGLAHQKPPTRTARLRYLRDLRAEVPEALLLSVADEMATGSAPPSLEAVLTAAREILALHWEQREKKELLPLVRGADLLEELGLPQGPLIGAVLRKIAEAEARGEVNTRAEALLLAKRLARELQPAGEEGRGG